MTPINFFLGVKLIIWNYKMQGRGQLDNNSFASWSGNFSFFTPIFFLSNKSQPTHKYFIVISNSYDHRFWTLLSSICVFLPFFCTIFFYILFVLVFYDLSVLNYFSWLFVGFFRKVPFFNATFFWLFCTELFFFFLLFLFKFFILLVTLHRFVEEKDLWILDTISLYF